MAPPTEYTTMPWALRTAPPTESVSDISSDTTDSSDSDESIGSLAYTGDLTAVATRPLNEALLQQLAESHSAQDRLKESLEDQKRASSRRIAKLEEDLAQCLKREQAVQTVFMQHYEKEQKLADKWKIYEEKEVDSREREAKLSDKEEEFEKKSVAGEKAMMDKESKLAEKEEAVLKKEEELNNKLAECKKVRCLSDCIHGPEAVSDVFDNYNTAINFQLDPSHETLVWLEFDSPVHLLRRHDYCKGWLDCMRNRNNHDALDQGILGQEDMALLYNIKDYRHPVIAGGLVGATFGWSVICHQHGVPEKDHRLDDRKWSPQDLEPKCAPSLDDKYFWQGVAQGKDYAERIFMEEMRSDNGVIST